MYKYAGIIVDNISAQVDKVFIYSIPENLRERIELGIRVKVPFGNSNKKIDGFIIELYENYESKINIKEIVEICDNYSFLNAKDIELIKFMRKIIYVLIWKE